MPAAGARIREEQGSGSQSPVAVGVSAQWPVGSGQSIKQNVSKRRALHCIGRLTVHRIPKAGIMNRVVQARTSFRPAYLNLWESGDLANRVERGLSKLRDCALCPRDCHVNRLADRFAVCRSGRYARVSSHFAHFGEEDCLRGTCGSGTIFFSGCNLRCVFCQNFEVSWQVEGEITPPRKLASMMLDLQGRGCHNINLVTPEHAVPQALEALLIAVEGGLRLPLVYNTGAYDSLDSLELMDGLIDIYMPDFKFWDPEMGRRYLRAPDYPETARRAIQAMHRQVGSLMVDKDGLALRGLILRHLCPATSPARGRSCTGSPANSARTPT
jgi:putative pyruvate formate lyase activating enzyme